VNRRKNIKWSLADGFLPFPTSIWKKNNIQVEIIHFGRRLLNNSVDVVYTRVIVKNLDKSTHFTNLLVQGDCVRERVFPLKANTFANGSLNCLSNKARLTSGKTVVYDFVIPANGEGAKSQIVGQGGFKKQYNAERNRILSKMYNMTMPVTLPDNRYIDLWKSSMIQMWNATVKTPTDYEQHSSGGTVGGYYQYDRVFDHDVPDQVNQYILEGNWDVAKKMMTGATYERLSNGKLAKEAYLDAIPKYLITMADYYQITGDKTFFTASQIEKLKKCARSIRKMRESQLNDESRKAGVYGLIQKGSTLDNGGKTFLIVDNFAALHGYAAYKYLCEKFKMNDELEWVTKEMSDLNDCLNNAIEKSVSDAHTNWYNACFSFDMDNHLVSGPGNWLGTTFEMPTFPWSAYLKGFNLKGAWATYLDNSVAKWLEVIKTFDCPDGSFGAWWNAKYGSVYNAGMVLPLLYSDKYRTLIPKSIDWLLDNQSAPLEWGESFYKPEPKGDWTRPETDEETWGLAFIRQAMLQMCISLHVDGSIIIGRGLPEAWINSQKAISWKNVCINGGKKINLEIQRTGDIITTTIKGDVTDGKIILDFPSCVSNIEKAFISSGNIIECNSNTGKVVATSTDNKVVKIQIKLKK
jgi:hypothetical protein